MISPFLKNGSALQKQIIGVPRGHEKTQTSWTRRTKQLRVGIDELKATDQTLRASRRKTTGCAARSNTASAPRSSWSRRGSSPAMPRPGGAPSKSTRDSNDGIEPDMPVLTEDGLVGKTTVVAANACHGPAHLRRKLRRGRHGRRDPRARHRPRHAHLDGHRRRSSGSIFFSKLADLKPGQKVTPRASAAFFPSGVLIGEIKEFEVARARGPATVIPAVDLTHPRGRIHRRRGKK